MSTAIYQRRYRKMRAMYGDRTIPATGTTRRIQALMALGWSGQRIANAAGMSQKHIWAIQNRPRGIYIGTAKVIAEVYETLSMTLPATDTTPQRLSVGKARALAARRGWAPPLAWDDIDTDEAPRGQRSPRHDRDDFIDEATVLRVVHDNEVLPTNKAERIEIMRRWLSLGRSESSLCDRMGWKDGRYIIREEVAS